METVRDGLLSSWLDSYTLWHPDEELQLSPIHGQLEDGPRQISQTATSAHPGSPGQQE